LSSAHVVERSLTLAPGKRNVVILPDDGTDRRLIRALHKDLGITRVEAVAISAIAVLREAKTRRGRLPEAELARLVTVIVEADAVFDFIHRVVV